MEAYCVKCKAKREMKDPQAVTMKNGKRQPRYLPVCGTGMYKIGGIEVIQAKIKEFKCCGLVVARHFTIPG